MKINFALVFLLFSLLLVGCSFAQPLEKITKYEWAIEIISDKQGNVLEKGVQYGTSNEQYEMNLFFYEDNTFLLTDKTNNKESEGNYTLKKVDNSYKLELFIKDKDSTIVGVYGKRLYNDGTEIPSITLETEKEILSFIVN